MCLQKQPWLLLSAFPISFHKPSPNTGTAFSSFTFSPRLSINDPPHLPKFVQNVQFTETLLYSGNVQAERGEGCAEPPAAGAPGVADGPCRPECGHLAPLHTGLSLCPCGLSSFRKEDNLSKHGREPGWLRGCERAEFFIFLSFLMVLRRQNYLSVWRESVKCGG